MSAALRRMRRRAPLVAVLAGRSPEDRYSLHRGYVEAVAAVGGLPVVVPVGPHLDADAILEAVCTADAIVLTGGGDISPAAYGAQVATELMEQDTARDALEVRIAREATSRGLRVLGICRGAQLLAVAHGGALVQDLPTAGFDGHWSESRQTEVVHGIEADPSSRAHRALAGAPGVNSIHHQAIAETGTHLVASAWSPDGVIEAIEAPGVLGLQWHPERLARVDPRHLAPFSWVVST